MLEPRQLRAGRGLTLRELIGGGVAVDRAPVAEWAHPWQVSPQWLGGPEQWVATVKPGFVNGQVPIWRTTIEAQELDGVTLSDDAVQTLTGAKNGKADKKAVLDVPLYFSPAIPLSFRPLGFDSDGTEAVPSYFLDLGVGTSPLPALEQSPDNFDAAKLDPPAGLRLLRVCDVWLHQPRVSLSSTVNVALGVATGLYTLRQTLSVDPAPVGDALQIIVGSFDPIAPPSFDATANNYSELGYDELAIAKVYLLSPRDAAPGSEPDGTWQAFVQHSLFWNLSYRQPTFVPPAPDPNAPYVVLLAAGVAQPVINWLTSQLNDTLLAVFNLFNAHSLAGTFWTATGGGNFTDFPATPPVVQIRNPLSKTERIQAQARARNAAKAANRLDPRFPFRAVPVDPDLFLS